jgi:hypothetical protein
LRRIAVIQDSLALAARVAALARNTQQRLFIDFQWRLLRAEKTGQFQQSERKDNSR